jgi:hypothetical protein
MHLLDYVQQGTSSSSYSGILLEGIVHDLPSFASCRLALISLIDQSGTGRSWTINAWASL